jgi:hypothetical protein
LIGAWKKWSAILAASVERDFERKSLPFLHLFWPEMIQTPPRSAWDSKGIDLLVWAEDGPLPCAVQCKGFSVQAIGDDQVRQTIASLEAFRRSGVKAHTYLMVHNREGNNRKFGETVQRELKQLVENRLVEKAELWDRHTLINRCHGRLREIIVSEVHRYSRQLLEEFQSRFRFGHSYMPAVPITEKRLTFKRYLPCTMTTEKPAARRAIGTLITSASRARWTLLTGRFGAGKTSSALHAAVTSKRATLVIACSALPPHAHVISSTNTLLENSLKALRILDAFAPNERETIYEIGGTTLARLLRGPSPNFLLVFDGLDENRLYSNLEGMQRLSNQLAELQCPVVLTTRTEHLQAMFGDFSLAFEELSHRSSTKSARLFELEAWTDDDVREFVLQACNVAIGIEQQRLTEFLRKVGTPSAKSLYGDLPWSPLFLQFILEDILSEGMQKSNRADLIDRWCKRKILRDRSVGVRTSLGEQLDSLDFVDRMIRMMEDIANEMTVKTGTLVSLAESIGSEAVLATARRVFNDDKLDVLPVLLNSLLMPVGLRGGSSLQITFAFRILHEYFLARYLHREQKDAAGYADSVRSFMEEVGHH